ncbi:MAG: V-type ATP synthase subunit E [Candidatus Eremiobacteraeota bacterium]|nr:V-type ATP synthase subunit E [Candidatus Eremiobacteraeota bacterium]
MSLVDLTEKIINDAKEEAVRIEKESTAEAEGIVAHARNGLEKEREKLRKEAERIANEKYQNIVTLARINARNKVLETKQNLIDEVFILVKKKIGDMSPDNFKKYALRLISSFPPNEETMLVVGKKYRSVIDDDFVRQLNEKIKGKCRGRFVLDKKDSKFDSGFYLVTGNVQIDLTFDSILKSIREDMELEIIKILFGTS